MTTTTSTAPPTTASLKQKVTKQKVTKKPEVVATVPSVALVTPVPSVTPVVISVEEVSVEEGNSFELQFESELKRISSVISVMQKNLKSLEGDLKNLRIMYQKTTREMNKKNRKKNRKPSTGKPHGFAKPCDLSPSLLAFLGEKEGTQLSSPAVTKLIAAYVRENNLYLPGNKAVFTCDAKLKSIIGEPLFLADAKKPDLGINHSFWNLQKTMKTRGNFIRPVVVPVTTV